MGIEKSDFVSASNILLFRAAAGSADSQPASGQSNIFTIYEELSYSCAAFYAAYVTMMFNAVSRAFLPRPMLLLDRSWLTEMAGHPLLAKTMTQDGYHLMASYSAGVPGGDEKICHATRVEFSIDVADHGRSVKIFQGSRAGSAVLLDMKLTEDGDFYVLNTVTGFENGKKYRVHDFSTEQILEVLQELIPTINHHHRQMRARFGGVEHTSHSPAGASMHLVN